MYTVLVVLLLILLPISYSYGYRHGYKRLLENKSSPRHSLILGQRVNHNKIGECLIVELDNERVKYKIRDNTYVHTVQ